jgi:hypothetical protein
MTPMFSAYVVVGEPPTDDARAVVAPRHLRDRLHVPGVLGDQGDHRGQHEQGEGE